MRVAAKNTVNPPSRRVLHRPFRHQIRHAQPGFAGAFQEPAQTMVIRVKPLQGDIQPTRRLGNERVTRNEGVKLMSMHGEECLSSGGPLIAFADRKAKKIVRDSREEPVMISFDPYHFNVSSRFAQRPEISKKIPVTGRQTAEIQIVQNITEQKETLKGVLFQGRKQGFGTAEIGTQVKVRENERFNFFYPGSCGNGW